MTEQKRPGQRCADGEIGVNPPSRVLWAPECRAGIILDPDDSRPAVAGSADTERDVFEQHFGIGQSSTGDEARLHVDHQQRAGLCRWIRKHRR